MTQPDAGVPADNKLPDTTSTGGTQNNAEGGRLGVYLLLHLLLAAFSFNGVFSKLASQYPFLSVKFILFYGCSIMVLGIYAIGWQQVIKHLPLTTAYANRAVTVVWGIVWGVLLFHEQLNAPKVIGALVVLAGVALFAWADNRSSQENEEVAQ